MSDPLIVFRQNNKPRDAVTSPSITLPSRARKGADLEQETSRTHNTKDEFGGIRPGKPLQVGDEQPSWLTWKELIDHHMHNHWWRDVNMLQIISSIRRLT